ncbi:DUF5412 domain-containing protein [Jeotgalibaca sp. MA1X17-3]|uniref:DUF5412 domain-containing protein n=1 Tax=Jeotgalibaca sp. MA1X17-3 TaxID=2908211 RepID=UPI001F1E47A4|nr:DUF5412 domain-containing protein [Jeotgalibaca sp. MA1X17-3]UJF16614.1 DUF5412 domain-containing protein [Jeotgalibaca sp. MA1X17-3]
MKKKIILSLLVIVGLLSYGFYWAFFDMNRLPEGELIADVSSPKETYTIKAYLTNGGATTSYAIRGELHFNDSNKKAKNIYWNNREEEVEIEWMDDDTVRINGIELEVEDEKFDFRRE